MSQEWVGAWYEAAELAERMNIVLSELVDWVREDCEESGQADLKETKDEHGNPLTLISSRWVDGEQEATRRDLARLRERIR